MEPMKNAALSFLTLLVSLSTPGRAEEDLGHGYVRKNGRIHFTERGVTGDGFDATRIDTPSASIIKGFKRAGCGPFETCAGLDVHSFEPLSTEHSRDRKHVYYKLVSPGVFLVIKLPKADPKTFQVIGFNIAKDQNHVWYYDKIQAGVDPATVELLEDGRTFKDKDSVHYGPLKIPQAEPKSFRSVGSAYFVDKARVYWGPETVKGADPKTFKVLGGSFVGKDSRMVYRSGIPLPDLDVATVELAFDNPAGFQILTDRNGVYLNGYRFLRSEDETYKPVDKLSGLGKNVAFLIDPPQGTPVTVYKEKGKLMAETITFDSSTRKAIAIMRAEIQPGGLGQVGILQHPDGPRVPSVAKWQIDTFKRVNLVARMRAAGRLLK